MLDEPLEEMPGTVGITHVLAACCIQVCNMHISTHEHWAGRQQAHISVYIHVHTYMDMCT